MSDTTVAPPAAAAPNIAPDAPTPPNAPVAPPVAAPEPTTPAVETPKPAEPAKPAAAGAEAVSPVFEKFKAVAAEIGLDDAKSKKLTEFYGSMQAEAEKSSEAEFTKLKQGWKSELAADPVFGGQNIAATEASSLRAQAHFGGNELVRTLEASGLSGHPAIVKAFAKVAKSMAEDTVSGTSSTAPGEPSEADLHRALYPSMFPNH